MEARAAQLAWLSSVPEGPAPYFPLSWTIRSVSRDAVANASQAAAQPFRAACSSGAAYMSCGERLTQHQSHALVLVELLARP